MRRLTTDDIMQLRPCWTRDRVQKIFDDDGLESVDALDVIDLGKRGVISADGALWLVLREEMIDARTLHLFACACARDALDLIDDPDPRSIAAIETKKRWLDGNAEDDELDAAHDAAHDATRPTARATAWATARATALDAAWDSAWDSAWAEQLLLLEWLITEVSCD